MILNASSEIALKCSKCGKYNVASFNIFNMKNKNTVKCKCGNEILKYSLSSNDVIIRSCCTACEKYHVFKLSLKNILEKNINILACPVSGMEICFLGKTPYINDIIEKYMDDMINLLKFIGIIEDKSKTVLK